MVKEIFLSLLISFNFINNKLISQNAASIFKKITVEQNLSSQTGNFYFFKESNGPIWISSYYGLNRYDGKTIKNYLPEESNQSALADGEIIGPLLKNKENGFWLSTTNFLYKYEYKTDQFERFNLQPPFNRNNNLLYFESSKNQLWLRNDKQLIRLTTTNFKDFEVIDSLNQLYGNGLTLIKNYHKETYLLLLPKVNGFDLKEYDSKKLISKSTFPKKNNHKSPVNAFLLEDENIIWVATDKGLLKTNLNEETTTLFNIFQEEVLINLVDIKRLDEENIIIATRNKGLYIFNTDLEKFTRTIFEQKESHIAPFQQNIRNIFIDDQKNLWINSPNNGIYFTNLKKNKFSSYLQKTTTNINFKNTVGGLTTDSKGQLWSITTEGIFVFDKNGNPLKEFWHLSENSAPYWGKQAHYLFCDKTDRIWILTEDGVFMIPPPYKNIKTIGLYNHDSKKISPILFMCQLSNQKIILLSYMDGAFEIEKNNNDFLLKPFSKLPTKSTYTYSYTKGIKLFSKDRKSLLLFKETNNWEKPDTSFTFSSFITGIAKQNNQKIYWISSSSGLTKISQKANTFYLEKDTLFKYENLKGIIIDNQDNLWISSTKNIIKYNPNKSTIEEFSSEDGLQSKEFVDWSYTKVNDSIFAFGGENGLNLFNSKEVFPAQYKVNPTIISLSINDKILENDIRKYNDAIFNTLKLSSIQLPFDKRTLSFRFSAMDFIDPDANEFKYRITPTETEWVHSGTENFARYANLAPGDYTFEVDATNSDGIWSNKPAQLDITILPPWYQTWWARTLAALGIAGIVFLIYRNRVQQIQKEADFKRKEAEYKQLAAETETAVLRLQMNPHFIFNSMNSISSYLLQKDIETANDYLGRFAKLMRKILIVAEEPYLPLYDEIELLEQYMQAEAMRFEEKFQYEFIVAEAIDTDEVLIPTMILQPFVENAIWHGISSKKGKGNIEIRFELENKKLICSITDNGIGRKAASQKSSSSHESKAISITQRRLNLLVSEHNLSFQPSLVIEDLVSPQNQPIGTKVILTLPQI